MRRAALLGAFLLCQAGAQAADQPLNPKDALAPIFRENPKLADPAADLRRLRNEGIAHYEGGLTLDRAIAAFQTAYETGHQPVDAFNLALVFLKQNKVPDARAWTEKALAGDANFANAQYLMGLIEKLDGHLDAAKTRWTRVNELHPADANLHYELAMLANTAGDQHGYLQELLRALELDPEHKSSLYQMYRYYQASGDKEMARSTLKRFNAIKAGERFSRKERPLDESGFSKPLRDDPSRGGGGFPFIDSTIAFETASPSLDCKLTQLTAATLLAPAAHEELIGLCEDGKIARIGHGATTVIGTLEAKAEAMRVEWLDQSGPRLIAAGPTGVMLSSPLTSGSVTFEPIDDQPAHKLILADFVHDGTLGILTDAAPAPLVKIDGKYRRQTEVYAGSALGHAFSGATTLAADLRRRGTADLVTIAGHDVQVIASGADTYRDGQRFHVSDNGDVTWTAVADLDNDGVLDLIAATGDGVTIVWGAGGTDRPAAAPTRLVTGGANPRFAIADMNNDGNLDIVAIDASGAASVFLNDGTHGFARRAQGSVPPPAGSLIALDENRDGLIDIAYAGTSGKPVVLRNVSKNTGKSIDLLLNGRRSPVTGMLTQVELRKGNLYAYAQSPGGLVHLGLGREDYAEIVRLEWPNGFVENKIKVDAATDPYVYLESERIAGSCPTVFVRGPNGFRYVTDAMITTAIGIMMQRGQYFGFGEEEHVIIPPGMLTEENGRLDLRITEELRETTYIDRASLLAVDHPIGARLGTTERLAPPSPEKAPWHAARRLVPAAHAAFEGKDVTALLAHRDQRHANTVHRTHDPGFAKPSVLTLELGRDVDPAKVDAVHATGWFLAFDSTAVMGAFKGEAPAFQFPELQEQVDGVWHSVGFIGIPAGQNRTAVLTLKAPLRSRHLRILSGFSVYWDEIAFSVAGEAQTKVAELPLLDASLRFHGFSQPISRDPEVFAYDKVSYSMIWSPMRGRFTNYGPVTSLLAAKDGGYVVIGGGDAIALSFRAPSTPPPPGFERSYVLVLDGHVKDADRYTALSDAVEPMPTLGMKAYPPASPAAEPPDAARSRQRGGLDFTLTAVSRGKERVHE